MCLTCNSCAIHPQRFFGAVSHLFQSKCHHRTRARSSSFGTGTGAMTNAVLVLIVPATVTLALAVDVAAVVAWMRNRRW